MAFSLMNRLFAMGGLGATKSVPSKGTTDPQLTAPAVPSTKKPKGPTAIAPVGPAKPVTGGTLLTAPPQVPRKTLLGQ